MRHRPVASLAAVVLTVGGLTAAPLVSSPAVAAPSGSLVFVKGHNVWISTPDGKRHHRVTKDGTAASPYRTPSMSDAGVIAAAKDFLIVRMRQDGSVLNRVDPPALPGSVANNPVDGAPSTVAISPDGTKIAWTVSTYQCPIGVSCGFRSATGYMTATGTKIGASTYFRNPSWVSNTRTLQDGGHGSHVMIHDLGTNAVNWFNDDDVYSSSTDLGDHALSRDGKHLASVRGYDGSTHVVWYAVSGNARTGTPPGVPTPRCATGEAAGFDEPTFSPDSSALAWAEPDGIWIKHGLTDCGSPQPRLTIAGASEPFWSAAALNPPKAPVASPAKALKLTKKPRVAGTAKVGRTVRVSTGSWSPRPTKVTYRWHRGHQPIKGKAGARKAYRLKKSDRGKRLRVKVTVTRAGHVSRSTWSTWTRKVKR